MAAPAQDVLLLAGRLGPGDACALRGLVDRLKAAGVAARVACLGGWAGDGGLECPGLGCSWKLAWAARRLRRGEQVARPALIHALGTATAPAALALADGWRVPYLLTVDDFLPPGGTLRLARRWCRGLIAGGRELADDLVDLLGVPRSWVHVVPPGLPLPERPACPRPAGVKVVGAAGAMAAGSGLATFLAAAVRVIATGLDVEFVLAGHGPDEPDLRRRADRLGISGRVTFAGDPGDSGAFWDVLDLYCQPSHRPDAGRPLATALAHGLPCLASDVPGLRSLVEDGDVGHLVPPGESEALADAILDLLADSFGSAALGLHARDSVARRFDPGREAADLADLYDRALTPDHAGEGLAGLLLKSGV